MGLHVASTATVKLKDVATGVETMEACVGIGPVDATFKAIGHIVGVPVQLNTYSVNKIEGTPDLPPPPTSCTGPPRDAVPVAGLPSSQDIMLLS